MSFHPCENCGTGNAAGAKFCEKCKFPLGEDTDNWLVCAKCDEWTLVDEMVDHAMGFVCPSCNIDLVAEDIDRAREDSRREDREVADEMRFDARRDDAMTEGGAR